MAQDVALYLAVFIHILVSCNFSLGGTVVSLAYSQQEGLSGYKLLDVIVSVQPLQLISKLCVMLCMPCNNLFIFCNYETHVKMNEHHVSEIGIYIKY